MVIMSRLLYGDERDERLRVVDGVALHIVVEVDEDIQPASAPVDDAIGPRLQRSPAIAKPVRGQMHPYICEAAGDLERFGHLWMIGDTERDPVAAKQFEDRWHEPRVVPKLDREAHVRRQHADEPLQTPQVRMEVRLKLEEDPPLLVTEAECRVDDKVDGLLLDGE